MSIDYQLAMRLLTMADEDQRTRAGLVEDGSLYNGYHPMMEAVHLRNAAELERIIEKHGWPGRSLVGEDGAMAAWLILQHAIGLPALQRRRLELLKHAASNGEVPILQLAMTEDRVRASEGKPQLYGTQFDWDAEGEMSPLPVDSVEECNWRRHMLGLSTLEEATRQQRAAVKASSERPPKDWWQRKREMEQWFRQCRLALR